MKLSTRKQNADFNRLPENKQRVEIAKDVLAQLDAQLFIARHGVYIDSDKLSATILNAKPTEQLQEILTDNPPACEVCALGSILLSTVRKVNNLTVGELREVTDFSIMDQTGQIMKSYLPAVFPKKQLRLIETAFESQAYQFVTSHEDANYHDVNAAQQYFLHEDFEDLTSEEQLRIIMQNIIFHDGDFNPHARPIEIRTWEFV